MNHLLLAETAYQVDDLRRRNVLGEDAVWIALGPFAAHRLSELELPYRIPEEFHETQELETLCRQAHRRLESLCRELDHKLTVPGFFFNIYPLTVKIDNLLKRAFQFDRLLKAFPDAQFQIHCNVDTRPNPLEVSPFDTLWGKVAGLAWKRDIVIYPESRSVDFSEKAREILRRWKRSFFSRKSISRKTNSDKAMLVVGNPHEWTYALPLFEQRGWDVIPVDHDQGLLPSPVREDWSLGRLIAEHQNDFAIEGISVLPLVADAFQWIAAQAPNQNQELKGFLSEIVSKYPVRALLVSEAATGQAQMLNELARTLGIKVFTWQFGFIGYNDEITQLNDCVGRMTADAVFTWGPVVKEAFVRYGKSFEAPVIVVGSASLDAACAHEPKPAARRRLLYVPTNYYLNSWYLGFPPGMSDTWLYNDQKVIVAALESYAKQFSLTALVKLHPSRLYRDPPWVDDKSHHPHVQTIKPKVHLRDLLQGGDIVILDLPSTTLMQSIAAGAPVYVLMRHWRYAESARESLGKRAVVKDDAGELMRALEQDLLKGTYSADRRDDEFLRDYGTFLNDGQSAYRAVESVETLLAVNHAGERKTAVAGIS